MREIPKFNVLYFDFNAKKLKPYNVITENLIEEFKKRTKILTSTEDKKKVLDDYFMYYYWSRREYELFIGDAFEEDISKYNKVDIYTQIQMNFDVIYDLVIKATVNSYLNHKQ